jgi:hypothetical protein
MATESPKRNQSVPSRGDDNKKDEAGKEAGTWSVREGRYVRLSLSGSTDSLEACKNYYRHWESDRSGNEFISIMNGFDFHKAQIKEDLNSTN